MEQKLYSTAEIAELLGISRIAVFKKIKSGEIKAKKVGRNFVIESKDMPEVLGQAMGKKTKQLIEQSVKKTVKEYGRALQLLGKE